MWAQARANGSRAPRRGIAQKVQTRDGPTQPGPGHRGPAQHTPGASYNPRMIPPSGYPERLRETLATLDIRNPSRPGDRMASVMLPILDEDAGSGEKHEPGLLLIVRTDRGRHGGQVALPGGNPEDGDATLWDVAVRETREEVGLAVEPDLLGTLGEFNTFVSRYRVLVHVAQIASGQKWVPQPDEVDAILRIPVRVLADLYADLPHVDDVWQLPIEAGFELDPSPFLVAGTLRPRGRGHRLETRRGTKEMPYIWGLTARIVYTFLREAWLPAAGAS